MNENKIKVDSKYKDWHKASSRSRMADKLLSVPYGPRAYKFHVGEGLELVFENEYGKTMQFLLTKKDADSLVAQIMKIAPYDTASDLSAKMTYINTLAVRLESLISYDVDDKAIPEISLVNQLINELVKISK